MQNIKLEVTRYFINKAGAIEITHIKVIDKETGKYVKFAKLKDVLPYLPKLEVRWKDNANT